LIDDLHVGLHGWWLVFCCCCEAKSKSGFRILCFMATNGGMWKTSSGLTVDSQSHPSPMFISIAAEVSLEHGAWRFKEMQNITNVVWIL
jgi:hypothetical protein